MSSSDCCNKRAFTINPQSKKVYCKKHFMEFIEKRVQKTISRYGMLAKDDHVALGFSGGKDSAVLLKILLKLKRRHPNCKLTVLTVDEGIKGYREECLELTQKQTEAYLIDHVIVSFKDLYGVTLDQVVAKSHQNNNGAPACTYCGLLRRRALNLAARKIGATKIATAHNLDDEAQSIVMNLLRGDVGKFIRFSRRSSSEDPPLIPRIRPLVRISEPEIVLYAMASQIEYHDIPCPYAASAMRNDIRTFLSEMEAKRPSTLINIVNAHDDLLKYFPISTTVWKDPIRCKICREISSQDICPVCQFREKLGIKASGHRFFSYP
ncbi:MAG: TIGR00269 family protein [Candidatus Heimdallarchaeota archaeon]